MNDALSHRGPDGEGIYLNGPVGLGHRRLSIFDLSEAGSQPMYSNDERFVIIFNGEVYNWPEIREKLKFKNWKSKTDTETIVQAYHEFGSDCLEMFNGMFALAIWDNLEKNLFLARDRVGIKPLYYGIKNQRLIFGSEIKALFACNYPKNTNYNIVGEFLKYGLIDHSNKTFFEGVESLDPGCFMNVKLDGNFELKRYWNLEEKINEDHQTQEIESISIYKELLQDSISLRSRGDVSIGVFLSGGIDSSILASQLKENNLVKSFDSYTYDFDIGKFGEEKYALEVAKWVGSNHKISKLSANEVPDYFNKVLYYEEMPITSLRVLASHKLYEKFSRNGSTIVLEGHGGDQLGAGFEYYFLANVMDLIEKKGSIEGLKLILKFMNMYKIPKTARLKKLLYLIGANLRVGSSTQDGVPFVLTKCFQEDFLKKVDSECFKFKKPFKSHLLNAQYTDLFHHNLPRILRYTDRGSMSVGREARVPILDHRIVEHCLNTSHNSRVKDTSQRFFMRKAADKLLPKNILNSPKRSIVDPQKTWLQNDLKEWLMDIFLSKSFKERGIFNQSEVIKEYENFCKQKEPETGFHIFQYLNTEIWFREIIDKQY
tara:strand:- start:12055 stop:13854 length:1800 start_codon:yes stop_codon:yes gene_type:complete